MTPLWTQIGVKWILIRQSNISIIFFKRDGKFLSVGVDGKTFWFWQSWGAFMFCVELGVYYMVNYTGRLDVLWPPSRVRVVLLLRRYKYGWNVTLNCLFVCVFVFLIILIFKNKNKKRRRKRKTTQQTKFNWYIKISFKNFFNTSFVHKIKISLNYKNDFEKNLDMPNLVKRKFLKKYCFSEIWFTAVYSVVHVLTLKLLQVVDHVIIIKKFRTHDGWNASRFRNTGCWDAVNQWKKIWHLISRRGDIIWTPRGPDSIPIDFFLRG